MKDSFVFYRDFLNSIEDLENEEQLEMLLAICNYGLNGTVPKFKGVKKSLFALLKGAIDRANARYIANIENGKKGGAPSGNQNARKQPKTTQINPIQPKTTENNLNDNVNVNVNVNDNVNDNENGNVNNIYSFSHSTTSIIFDDVFAYGVRFGASKQYCKKFFDYYAKRGWVNNDGKQIDDWQSVFDNWWEKDKGNKAEIKPSWIDKEVTGEKATKEEMQAMDELLGKRGKKQ